MFSPFVMIYQLNPQKKVELHKFVRIEAKLPFAAAVAPDVYRALIKI
jgi:hypothetical protein